MGTDQRLAGLPGRLRVVDHCDHRIPYLPVLPREAALGKLACVRTLTHERVVSDFAQDDPECEARYREPRWTVERRAHRARELLHSDGIAGGVHGPAQRGRLDSVCVDGSDVVYVDPAHPLAAGADRSAHEELERQ